MRLKTVHILFYLLFGLSCHLYAQQIVEKDSVSRQDVFSEEITEDSLRQLEQSFYANLIIPSYEELLEVYYEAVVEVDKRLNFNIFRFDPYQELSPINPYVYNEVIYQEKPFDIYQQQEASDYSRRCIQIYSDVLRQVAMDKPEVVTATCAMIPDPPKAEKKGIIYSIDVDLSRIDTSRQSIRKPEKIEQLSMLYQPWQLKAIGMLNANQTMFNNWAKGGENSFTLSGRVTLDANYESFDKKTKWDNDVEYRIGYIQQEGDPFVKNLDYFMCNSRFARNAFKHWFYALNTQLSTQFFEGYDIKKDNFEDPTSNFFTPAYVKVALGLDYKYGTKKQKKLFSMQASPLSYKLTYVRDTSIVNPKKYGVEEGHKARQEIGGSVEFVSKYDVKEKFNARSRLLFFSNYVDNPQNVDVNWNTSMTYHFSRIFSVTLSVDMVYDDDVDILIRELDDGTKVFGQRLQLKEFVGFGLTYRLM